MSDIKELAGFAIIPYGERKRVSYSYNSINEHGKVVESNRNEDYIVLDEEMIKKINELWKMVEDKMNHLER